MGTPAESPSFSVIQFTLELAADNRPAQRSQNWGNYGSVEEAFHQARTLACGTRERLRQERGGETPTLLDTEWGYDLRLGPLTVHRFWVHESFRSQRQLL